MAQRIIILALCALSAGVGAAQTPHSRKLPILGSWTCINGCPTLGCCPDDYCRKPAPLLCPLPRSCAPDDYCRKPMPCLTDILRCGSCDDYCRKPMPSLLCPPFSPFLRCAPADAPCAPSPVTGVVKDSR